MTPHLHTSSDFISLFGWVEQILNGLHSHYIHIIFTLCSHKPAESHTHTERHLLGLNEPLKGRTKRQCLLSLERDAAKTTAHPHDDLSKRVCVQCVFNQTGIEIHTAAGFFFFKR